MQGYAIYLGSVIIESLNYSYLYIPAKAEKSFMISLKFQSSKVSKFKTVFSHNKLKT